MFENSLEVEIIYISSLMEPKISIKGEYIIEQGQTGHKMYLITEGLVHIKLFSSFGAINKRHSLSKSMKERKSIFGRRATFVKNDQLLITQLQELSPERQTSLVQSDGSISSDSSDRSEDL